MPYYCTVPRCTSMAGKVKNVSFHQFPRDEELAKLWNEILKRGKPYTKYSKVCSLHFKPEDYTVTSVGKNKGQWRTLRKDAIPSQNLPSDTPVAHTRRQSEPWLPNSSPILNIIDPMIHQQVAQAIYMQTMLAMKAISAPKTSNIDAESYESQDEESTNTSTSPDVQQSHKPANSYKCNHCTKCFKDPDVFLLHKRNHTQALESFEKENFNINTALTVQANPILVNLLKNKEGNIENTQNNQISLLNDFGSNIDQYISLAVLAKSDCTLSNRNMFNFKNGILGKNQNVITHNDILNTINQSDNTLNIHEVGEKTNSRNDNINALAKSDHTLSSQNMIDFKNSLLGNNQSVISDNYVNDVINQSDNTYIQEVCENDNNSKIHYKHGEILKQPVDSQKSNECIINECNNSNAVSKQLHGSVSDFELHSDRLLSKVNESMTDGANRVDVHYDKGPIKDNESVDYKTDKVNERIQRLALLANTNYSLISDDVERANLIFGNGKIIEGVIDFKLNDRVN